MQNEEEFIEAILCTHGNINCHHMSPNAYKYRKNSKKNVDFDFFTIGRIFTITRDERITIVIIFQWS
jgi:hypothetical protein